MNDFIGRSHSHIDGQRQGDDRVEVSVRSVDQSADENWMNYGELLRLSRAFNPDATRNNLADVKRTDYNLP